MIWSHLTPDFNTSLTWGSSSSVLDISFRIRRIAHSSPLTTEGWTTSPGTEGTTFSNKTNTAFPSAIMGNQTSTTWANPFYFSFLPWKNYEAVGFQVRSRKELWNNTKKEREKEKAFGTVQKGICPSADAEGTTVVQLQQNKCCVNLWMREMIAKVKLSQKKVKRGNCQQI